VTLRLRSMVCRSVMATDLPEGNVVLDNVVPGRTVFKDFSIWNRSEIDLCWAAVVSEVASDAPAGASALTLVDMDSGDPLADGTVPRYVARYYGRGR